MKHIKLFENFNNIDYIMSDEEHAIDYLDSINFFEDHGFEKDDEIILDNISNIIYHYRWLKEDTIEIYRQLKVPGFNSINFNEIGQFWSFNKEGVGAYDAGVNNKYNKNWDNNELQYITITAKTNKNNIDWLETLIANAIYGEEQFECYMKKDSPVLITHIDDKKLEEPIKASV